MPPGLQRDVMTLEGAESHPNRDRARTPLRWDSAPGGGFTADGVTPWLPFGADPTGSVADQRANEDSMLWLCRRLIALRKSELGGRVARYRRLDSPPGTWVYQTGALVVAANLSDEPVVVPGPAGPVLIATTDSPAGDGAAGPLLAPWSGRITRQP